MKKFKVIKKSLGVILIVGMMTSMLSACSSKTQTATTTTNESQDKHGGTLKFSVTAGPQTMFLPKSTSTGDKTPLSPAIEPLGRVNDKGVTEPWLAESFKVDATNLTFTIKLRPDVKFHDGSILNAEALKWNLDKLIENGKGSELDNPASFKVVDDLTVEIKFSKWANNWQDVIGDVYIISKEAYEKNGQSWCEVHAVGTGPFILESNVQDSKITYKRNDSYRIKDQPYLDKIEIDVISDANTQLSAFKNGEVDTMTTKDAIAIAALESSQFKNAATKTPALSSIAYVIPNSKDPSTPLSNLKVRKAIMQGIDFKNVAKSLTGGLGYAENQFGVPGAFSYNTSSKLYDYDLQKSKSMLAEAGYPNGFKTSIFTNSTPDYAPTAVALQACLKEIGITAEIKTLDKSVLAARQVKESMPGFVIGNGAGQMDFTNNYIRLYSSQGIKNHGIIAYPAEYETALFGAREAKTLDEKKKLLQEASKMLVEDNVLLFPMAVSFSRLYLQERVHELGYLQVNGTNWTPEAAWVSTK